MSHSVDYQNVGSTTKFLSSLTHARGRQSMATKLKLACMTTIQSFAPLCSNVLERSENVTDTQYMVLVFVELSAALLIFR